MVIKMDGRELTRLYRGLTWASNVEPGRHILRVTNWLPPSPPLELVLAPGDDVRLEARLQGREAGFWAWGVPILVPTDAATTDPPVDPSVPLPVVQVLGVTETHRSEEPIGTETRRIDNTSGGGRLTRTIRVTKEWNRMVSTDLHETNRPSGRAQIGPNWLQLKATLERSLEHTYAISASRREEFAEEIGVEIELGADVTLVLTWKRIWQHGLADVLIQGRHFDVPFRMAVGVTFDQSSASAGGSAY